ncbi:unnamed protein product [Arctogadus glacialis]
MWQTTPPCWAPGLLGSIQAPPGWRWGPPGPAGHLSPRVDKHNAGPVGAAEETAAGLGVSPKVPGSFEPTSNIIPSAGARVLLAMLIIKPRSSERAGVTLDPWRDAAAAHVPLNLPVLAATVPGMTSEDAPETASFPSPRGKAERREHARTFLRPGAAPPYPTPPAPTHPHGPTHPHKPQLTPTSPDRLP